jgi:hypothetical protein
VVAWLGVALAAGGAVTGFLLAGGRWAIAGAVIGAVTGSFAPALYDRMRDHGALRDLLRSTVEPAPGTGWARLLDPRREVVRFTGREVELAALTAWCDSDAGGRLRLVTGPGGVGKTRLAVELAERMRRRGWWCERVADGQEDRAIAALRGLTRQPALLVVDDAETRIGLRVMLTSLACGVGARVRVLLLARSAGDWWDQLGAGQPAVWEITQTAKIAELELTAELAADLTDADVIARAVTAFARELNVPERAVQLTGGSGAGGSGAGDRRVLDLHAAALVALLHAPGPGPVRVDIGSVLAELLRHESRLWDDGARVHHLLQGPGGLTEPMARQLVAVGCLLGAATEEEARLLAGRVPGVPASVRVARWLRDLYPPRPGETDWLGSLRPGRLAELHTVRELAAAPGLARSCLRDLDDRQAKRAVTLLAHACTDEPEAERLLSQAIPDVAGLAGGVDAPLETLIAIYNAIPHPSVVLAEAAVRLAERITAALPVTADPEQRAFWLSNLGGWCSALARPAEALPPVQQAVTIRRGLAAANPDRYRPGLARSLTTLAGVLARLDRTAEAAAARSESAELGRAQPGRPEDDE